MVKFLHYIPILVTGLKSFVFPQGSYGRRHQIPCTCEKGETWGLPCRCINPWLRVWWRGLLASHVPRVPTSQGGGLLCTGAGWEDCKCAGMVRDYWWVMHHVHLYRKEVDYYVLELDGKIVSVQGWLETTGESCTMCIYIARRWTIMYWSWMGRL